MSTNVKAVLAYCYTRPVQLTDFYVSAVLNRRKTTELVRVLSEKFPLDKFQHLKRVRNVGGKGLVIQVFVISGL